MFELATEIPITFVPHDLDIWAVGATFFGASTALVVAALAWRNGQKATRIAQEASDRDEAYRVAETERLKREARAAVALAMQRTFAALEQQKWDPSSNPSDRSLPETRRVLDFEAEALAQIDLYPLNSDDEELRVWFASAVATIKQAPNVAQWDIDVWVPSFMDELAYARIGATAWNNRVLTASQLTMGAWPPDPEDQVDPEGPAL